MFSRVVVAPVVVRRLVHVVGRDGPPVAQDEQVFAAGAQLESLDQRRVRDFARLHDVGGGGLDHRHDAPRAGDKRVRARLGKNGVPGRGVSQHPRARYAAHQARHVYVPGHRRQGRASSAAGQRERHRAVVAGRGERQRRVRRREARVVQGRVEHGAEHDVVFAHVPHGHGAVRARRDELFPVPRPMHAQDRGGRRSVSHRIEPGTQISTGERIPRSNHRRARVEEFARHGARLEVPDLHHPRGSARGEQRAPTVERRARRAAALQRLLENLQRVRVGNAGSGADARVFVFAARRRASARRFCSFARAKGSGCAGGDAG